MFGPLFHSQKNPKGPNLKHLESLSFDLSGNQLSFSVPSGNCKQLPNPQGEVHPQTNLYAAEQFGKDVEVNWYSIRTIFNRDLVYTCFTDPSLGSFKLMVMLNKLDNLESNLFTPSKFKTVVKKRTEYACERSNKTKDDAFLKLHPSKTYEFSHIGHEDFLMYEVNFQLMPFSHYSIALTHGHFISFGFLYYSVRDGNEAWYLMAKKLERQIMESVKLELTPSFLKERESANVD